MDEQARGSPPRRLRWRLGVLMIAIAIIAGAFALLRRPQRESLAVQFALDVLRQYQPGFNADEYRVDRITGSSGPDYWEVHFEKTGNTTESETVVSVPVWRIEEARRFFWEKRPNHPVTAVR